jgi:hypothetical protein
MKKSEECVQKQDKACPNAFKKTEQRLVVRICAINRTKNAWIREKNISNAASNVQNKGCRRMCKNQNKGCRNTWKKDAGIRARNSTRAVAEYVQKSEQGLLRNTSQNWNKGCSEIRAKNGTKAAVEYVRENGTKAPEEYVPENGTRAAVEYVPENGTKDAI